MISGHKAQTGTRAQQTPRSVHRPVSHASPTHPQQTTSARDRTDLTHSCTHTTHRHATCGLMRARAHAHIDAHTLSRAHLRSLTGTYFLACAQTPRRHARALTPRAHALLRTHTPSGARTRSLCSREGRNASSPRGPGWARPGEGAARGGAGVVCRSPGRQTLRESPASSRRAGLSRAARVTPALATGARRGAHHGPQGGWRRGG